MYFRLIVCISGFIVLSSGCRKDSPQSVTGTLELEISAVHHSWGVPNLPVFLKKNALQFPGDDTTVYDYRTLTGSDGRAFFEMLHPGDYYVYSKGYDMIWGDTVIGKKSIRVVTNTSLTLPVSE